jgi:ATP-binding cassette subfamily B protein
VRDGPHRDRDTGDLRWLLGYVRPHAGALACVVAVALVGSALALVQPYLTKHLIDDGLLAARVDVVVRVAALIVAAAALATALAAINQRQYVVVSARVLFAIRESVYRHLLSLSPAFHARTAPGELLARLDGDVAEIQRFAVDPLLSAVNAAIVLAGSLGFLLVLSPPLSLLAAALLPAEIVFLRVMRRRVEERTRNVRRRASRITAFLVETLGATKLVQSFRAEDRETDRLAAEHRGYLDDLVRLQMTQFTTSAVPGLFVTAATAVVFVAGAVLVTRGRMSVGGLIAFSAYLTRATAPVQTLLGIYVAARRARVSAERVRELLDEAAAVVQPERARELPYDARGEVEFQGVCFTHEGRTEPLLDGVDAVLRGGSKVAIVGVSGAGKTTLIDLLQRHYDPTKGRILLDGNDLRDLDLGVVRRRIAVVAQDVPLLSGTIAENIRYAVPEASDDDVRRAARLAQIDAFVAELPRGYETEIGPRGVALSGGQRQRIAIARALLMSPLVLVLDEATSAVDTSAQARILEAIDGLFGGTKIIISHHAAALAGVDRRLELVGGKLVDSPELESVARARS